VERRGAMIRFSFRLSFDQSAQFVQILCRNEVPLALKKAAIPCFPPQTLSSCAQ
jgi:hypothetical protein